MRRVLKRAENRYWYSAVGGPVFSSPEGIRGDLSGIRGNLSCIRGDLSGIRGDLSDIRGDLSGITGDLSDIRGDLSDITGNLLDVWGDVDTAEITDSDRKMGITVSDLVEL